MNTYSMTFVISYSMLQNNTNFLNYQYSRSRTAIRHFLSLPKNMCVHFKIQEIVCNHQ